jgi:excisionase family DNA binding protein
MRSRIPDESSRLLPCLRTKREAAQVLRISADQLDRLRRRGEIAARKIGALVRFSDQDLTDYIDRCKEGTAA